MKKYVLLLFVIASCNQKDNCLSHKSIGKYKFDIVEFKTIDKDNVNEDSLFLFLERNYPRFNKRDITQEQLASIGFLKNTSQLPEYVPMDISYFDLDNEFCDSDKVLRIAFFCHNIMTNGADFEINTSRSEILNTSLDSIIVLLNTNKLIGQCGEYDAFAKLVYEKYGYQTITANPTLYDGIDSLGHVYTIVYSPHSKRFYPIDVQNNCYWTLRDGELADFQSIMTGLKYSRQLIDTINGRKDIILSDFLIPFEFRGNFLATGKYRSISTSSEGLIYRTIIEPNEVIRPNNYMDRTSKALNKKSPTWEDFIFNAGILNDNDKINQSLFHGKDQTLNKFWRKVN